MRTSNALRFAIVAAAMHLAACTGGSTPHPAPPAPPPAELRAGDLRIIASMVDTTTLPAQVTKQYNIPRAEDTWMLLVVVRRGPEGQEVAVPAAVEARARTLNGNAFDIRMRETRTAQDYVDSIGTFSVTPPDTLQFTLKVTPQGAPTSTLSFTRELSR